MGSCQPWMRIESHVVGLPCWCMNQKQSMHISVYVGHPRHIVCTCRMGPRTHACMEHHVRASSLICHAAPGTSFHVGTVVPAPKLSHLEGRACRARWRPEWLGWGGRFGRRILFGWGWGCWRRPGRCRWSFGSWRQLCPANCKQCKARQQQQ